MFVPSMLSELELDPPLIVFNARSSETIQSLSIKQSEASNTLARIKLTKKVISIQFQMLLR